MTYDCMTPEELAFYGAPRPCYDCPAWFEQQARDAGCCRRVVLTPHRLEQQRQAQRRYRARLRGVE